MNFLNGYLVAPPLRLGLHFFMRRPTIARKRRRPRIKNRQTTQRYELSPANRIVLPAEFDTASAVSGISREPYRPETEALLRSLNHGPCRADFGLRRPAGFDGWLRPLTISATPAVAVPTDSTSLTTTMLPTGMTTLPETMNPKILQLGFALEYSLVHRRQPTA